MISKLKEHLHNRESDKLIALVESHPEILDQKDERGISGLLLLAYSGMPELVEKVITHKKDFTFWEAIICGRKDLVENEIKRDSTIVNKSSEDGYTPIVLVAFFDQPDIALLLLEHGADPATHSGNTAKVNALHAATAKNNYALCKRFLEHGVPADSLQAGNVTPLHAACHRGNLDLVQLLIEHGANPDLAMDSGDTARTIASRDGHNDVFSYLRSIG